VLEHDDGVVYMSASLRNVGTGLGLLRGWYVWPDAAIGLRDHVETDQFRSQIRDLLIPAGGFGLWQGALRHDDEEIHGAMRDVIANPRIFMLDLLYTDHLGEQPAISRFSIAPTGEGRWVCSATRHWDLA
jgi:hypothetical protein